MSKNIAINLFVEEEPAHFVAVPRSASVAEVRRRWEEASGVTSCVTFVMESPEGAVLPAEGALGEPE